MYRVVSPEVMRRCEERNFAAGTADALELMQIAGNGCAGEFLKFFSTLKKRERVIIYTGGGNNGGDGMVAASILADKLSIPVVLAMAAVPEKLSESSHFYFERLNKKVTVMPAGEVQLNWHDAVIDALLGTGCTAPIREPYCSLIEYINNSHVPVFAVDLPSGLGSDRCIKASRTAVIGYFKDLLFTPEGIENAGTLRRIPLPLPITPETGNAPLCQAVDLQYYQATTQSLPRSCHKYQKGNLLICGGSCDYIQAPFLSARSALRAGAGLVRLALPFAVLPGTGTLGVIPMHLAADNGYFSEASFDMLKSILPKCHAIAAGPGMGRSSGVADFIRQLLLIDKPLLLDADAIHASCQLPLNMLRDRTAPTIFTPHRGEAAIMAQAWNLSLSGNDIQDARSLARTANVIVLLKGPRTVVAAPDGELWLNTSGSPALAAAGSGDCLTGIIASNMCRYDALSATLRGAFLHGLAGELAEQHYGVSGVIADDLPEMAAQANMLTARYGDIFA